MTGTIIKKPLIGWGWLRVLLFCMSYFILYFLVSTSIGSWTGLSNPPAEKNGSELSALSGGDMLWLSVLSGVVVSVVLVFVFRKWIDRQPFASLGFKLEGYQSDGLTGFFLAISIVGLGSLILFLSKHLRWTDFDFDGNRLFISFGIAVLAAFGEELVFRGYVLNNLMQSINKWLALIISAVLFTLFHLGAPGIGFVPLINIFLAGILIGINYIYTKNLWYAILFHLAWNFFEGPLLGFKVSGLSVGSLLQTDLKGEATITGGDFGLEGSIVNMGLLLAAIFCVYLTYERRGPRVEAAP